MEILQFFGRFHPVVLHLPIGFLVLGYLMQIFSRKPAYQALEKAVGFSLVWGFASAALTTLLGYWLSTEGGYEEKMLNQHKWMGIATVALSGLVYAAYRLPALKKAYFPLYSITVVALLITGHLGGNITHGSDYLLEKAPNGVRAVAGLPPVEPEVPQAPIDLDEAVAFTEFVRPIIEKKCVSCHNPGKVKGELLLNTVDGIKKGGKTGPFVVAGKLDESLMSIRMHLPTTEKKHMPPRGKLQLDTEEKALVDWWIEQGADFGKQVLDMEVPENIQNILDKRVAKVSPVFAMTPDPVSKSKLQKMKAEGIRIQPIAEESPLLQAVITDKTDQLNQALKQLAKGKENLIKLDLSRSAVTDDMLKKIARFENLIHLRLDGTQVTDAGLKNLQKLEYLEYLNLYGTAVTDEGIAALSEMPQLQQLYIWQTDVSKDGAQALKASLPQLQVNFGEQADTMFNDVRLKPPVIVAEQDLFTDSMEIALNLNLANVDIHFTLDGSEPTDQSPKYETSFVIKESTPVKAIALKKGWQASDIADQQFIFVKYKPVSTKIDRQPSERYAANGAASLTDLTKGTTRFTDGNWLGWNGEDMTAILDLGTEKEINGVSVSALESTGQWIFFPKGIRVSTSSDGKNFVEVISSTYPVAETGNQGDLRNFLEQFPEPVNSRFVKIEVFGRGVNPPWHAAAGQPCWLFLDEIIVE